MIAVNSADDVTPIVPRALCFAIDYGQSLEEMIAAGHYGRVNRNITAKHFPIKPKRSLFIRRRVVRFEAQCIHPNRCISSENVLNVIGYVDTCNPWMPANIEQILSYGAVFPEEQCKHPIVGLGSVAEVIGGRGVPSLGRVNFSRELLLSGWDGMWTPEYRFLAVREI